MNQSPAAIIGFLIDVSGSMAAILSSMNKEDKARYLSAFEAIKEMLDSSSDDFNPTNAKADPSSQIFALGFGFKNPLSILMGRNVSHVQDILTYRINDTAKDSFLSISVANLIKDWEKQEKYFNTLQKDMFGASPLGESLDRAIERFDFLNINEYVQYDIPKWLIIITDGMPTDYTVTEILQRGKVLKSRGVRIACCLLTSEPEIFRVRDFSLEFKLSDPDVNLLSKLASNVEEDISKSQYLKELGWNAEPSDKLFLPVNDSKELRSFLSAIIETQQNLRNDSTLKDSLKKSSKTKKVFISYAHRDRRDVEEVIQFLKPLKRHGFDFWIDNQIVVGEKWNSSIEKAIEESDIALVLITQNFLASDFCMNIELPFIQERVKKGIMVIKPILLRSCAWHMEHSLNDIQLLTWEGQPLFDQRRSQSEFDKRMMLLHEVILSC